MERIKLLFLTFFITSQLNGYLCQQKTITVDGTLEWVLIFRYDNSKNSAEIKHTVSTRTYQSYDHSEMKETIEEVKKTESTRVSAGLDVTATYKAVSASAKASTEYSKEVNNFFSSKITTSSSSKFEYEKTETREYTVGPKSVLALYQLQFDGPGVQYHFPALSTVYEKPKKVPVTVVVEPVRFVSNIRVQYADNEGGRPTDRIREISNKNDDINYKYGGKYVYLVPEYTYKTNDAMTNIDIVIQSGSMNGYSDLAKGAGGSYRYVVPVKDTYSKKKMTEVALLRNENSAGSLPEGYAGITIDINKGRGRDYLHLIWKAIDAS